MNARTLFLEAVGSSEVSAAILEYDNKHDPVNPHLKDRVVCVLGVGHDDTEFEEFLQCIDFNFKRDEYGCGLSGTMWFKDGGWVECCGGLWGVEISPPPVRYRTRLEMFEK